jgi:hypothetical protein
MSTEIAVLGLPVSLSNPVPVSFGPGQLTWTQTVVVLGAAASATLVAANPNRKGLRWMNVGANPMTVVPDAGPAVAGTGMSYNGAAGTGQQGGADTFPGDTSAQQFTAISTLGTTVVVWEGV